MRNFEIYLNCLNSDENGRYYQEDLLDAEYSVDWKVEGVGNYYDEMLDSYASLDADIFDKYDDLY